MSVNIIFMTQLRKNLVAASGTKKNVAIFANPYENIKFIGKHRL